MVIRFFPKLALATVAAVGLYVPTVGLPVPLRSCVQTVGVAAAAPSPTCGGDERECLRRSAKTGLYGVRYVTPEDVAKCVEAFNACIHGSLHGGNPAPPTSTSATGGNREGLPQHFGITYPNATYDCRVSGETVSCTMNYDSKTATVDSWTGEVHGTLSGLTMTGTETQLAKSHDDTGCTGTEEFSSEVTYVFDPAGKVLMRRGPVENKRTVNCPGGPNESHTETMPAAEWPANWSALS